MKLTEKTLEQEYLFHGKIIQVRLDKAELENGAVVNRDSGGASRRRQRCRSDRPERVVVCPPVPLSLQPGTAGTCLPESWKRAKIPLRR